MKTMTFSVARAQGMLLLKWKIDGEKHFDEIPDYDAIGQYETVLETVRYIANEHNRIPKIRNTRAWTELQAVAREFLANAQVLTVNTNNFR